MWALPSARSGPSQIAAINRPQGKHPLRVAPWVSITNYREAYMASKKVPKRPKKGYFGDVRWTFNTRVRTTLVAWMRELRARIWVVAPLAGVLLTLSA